MNKKEWVLASLVNRIPFAQRRMRLYARFSGIRFEELQHTLIFRGVEIIAPEKLSLGRGTIINRHVILDASGGLDIGREVGIAERSVVLTGGHSFDGGVVDAPRRTRIEDMVFVNLGARILAGVTVGEGAVIGAGALVDKDVEPWTIVAGSPAKKIADRTPSEYTLYRAGVGKQPDWR